MSNIIEAKVLQKGKNSKFQVNLPEVQVKLPTVSSPKFIKQFNLFGGFDTINLNSLTRVTKRRPARVSEAIFKTIIPELNNIFYRSPEDTPQEISDSEIKVCSSGGAGYNSFVCDDCGAVLTKLIGCNKEYCPECGERNGILHQQRYYRGVNKIKFMYNLNKTLGYWVITLPKEYRSIFSDPKKLNQLQNYVKRFFKETLGYEYGLLMYHWCGEDGKTFIPHLNMLIPSGYLLPKEMLKIKKHISAEINRIAGGSVSSFVINYNYTEDYKKALHKWRYVCRPTWREYSIEIEKTVFNYRNQRFWGDYTNKIAENSLEKVAKMKCPLCDGSLRYSKEIGFEHSINRSEYTHLGGGVYLWKKYLNTGDVWIREKILKIPVPPVPEICEILPF